MPSKLLTWPDLPEQLRLPGAGHLGGWGPVAGSLAGESTGYLLAIGSETDCGRAAWAVG